MSTSPGTVAGVESAESAEHQAPGFPAGRVSRRPFEARLEVLRAQNLLVELTGCPADSAHEALRRIAEDLDVDPASVAHQLLHGAGSLDHHAERFVARVERMALASALEGSWSADGHQRPLASAVPIVSGDLRGVTVTGEIDVATTLLLDLAVAESCSAAAANGPRTRSVFLLNLADVTFLDASGLRALTEAQEHAEAGGYEVRVATPIASGPRRLLRLAVEHGWLDPLYRPPDDGQQTHSGVPDGPADTNGQLRRHQRSAPSCRPASGR